MYVRSDVFPNMHHLTLWNKVTADKVTLDADGLDVLLQAVTRVLFTDVYNTKCS